MDPALRIIYIKGLLDYRHPDLKTSEVLRVSSYKLWKKPECSLSQGICLGKYTYFNQFAFGNTGYTEIDIAHLGFLYYSQEVLH
jgi:hypothetical protein